MKSSVDVVIVGAGPVGLLAAIELTLAGARVVLLERLAAPSTTIKALGIGPLGAEALMRRGLGETLAAAETQSSAAWARFRQAAAGGARTTRFSGHFGFLFISADPQKEPERRMHAVDQQSLEAMLGQRATALGIDLRRDCTVTEFEEHDDGIDVTWTSPAGREQIRCTYLVGCDGGRSTVRKMAGFAFPGTPPTMTMYQGIADINDPEGLLPVGWRRMVGGVVGNGPLPRRVFMLDFSGPPENRDAPVTREEFEAVIRRVSGVDVRVTALDVANRWTDNTRLVDTYRKGRVLLAGDAAHIHSPFGGQGLSLGLVDAANLGWKLAAVVRGEMPESLLETYTVERRPVAEAVLANTLAQAAVLRPDPQTGALREIVAKLLELDDVSRFFGEMMRGLSVRYDLGSERDEVGRLLGDQLIREGDADLSVYDLMHEGAGVFLDASPDGIASKLVAAKTSRVRCIAVEAGRSMLIRPDACVAWAGERDSTDGLDDALRRWFSAA